MSRIGTAILSLALLAQHGMAQSGIQVQLGAHGVVSATHVNRVVGGGSLQELRLEQTMLMGTANLLSGHLQLVSTVSLDRAVSDDGVFTLGTWGGGFYDRHHPHDYFTEGVASFVGEVGIGAARPRVSLSAGKGVVPFGTDTPMDRPPLRSTANHHWSQILERWFGALAIRGSRVGLEMAVFDATEHIHEEIEAGGQHTGHGECETCAVTPSTTSGSARVTVWPASWAELRLSGALLRVAEHHAGAGNENRMLNIATAVNRTTGIGRVTGLLEYGQARADRTFRTMLGEVQLSRERYRTYYRAEQSDRAEGARFDRFRSAPEIQENAVGTTRWTVHSLGGGVTMRKAGIAFEPIAELGIARARSIGAAPFDVEAFYGKGWLWSGVIALRVSAGSHRRMGRYGAMADVTAHSGHQH